MRCISLPKSLIRKVTPILYLLFWISLTLNAQNFSRLDKKLKVWYSGTIVFETGEKLDTRFAYNPLVEEGLIQIEGNDGLMSFGPGHISSFSFMDNDTKLERRFESIPLYNKNTSSTRKYFLEILFESNIISILGKKTLQSYTNGLPTKLSNNYDRYLVDMKSGELHLASKKNLFLILDEKSKEVRSFARKNRLNFKETTDFIIVIDYVTHLDK
jgi:hypothetical protein